MPDIFDEVSTATPGGKPKSDVFDELTPEPEGNTISALVKAPVKGVNLGVGRILKGMELLGSFGGTSPGQAPTPEMLQEQQRLNADPAERLRQVRSGPLYQAGQFIGQTGKEIDTGKPTTIKKILESAGEFAPLIAAGPAAPLAIGAQSAGDVLDDKYDQYKKSGLSDEEAAGKAMDVASLTGGTQALTWAVLPKPLKSVVEKVIGDTGTSALKQFLIRRARGAAEGAVLGGVTKAEENLTTGEPIGRDVASSALGLAGVNAFMPQPGRYRRPAPPEPVPPRRIAGLLPEKTGVTFEVTPEGKAADITQMSPFEKSEFNREAEAESRQTEGGQERVVNTIAASLGPETPNITTGGVKWNGSTYYKQGDFWVSPDAHLKGNKPVFSLGRGNVTEDAIVRELDKFSQQKRPRLTPMQQRINDVTGVNRESPESAEGTGLRFREEWEKQLLRPWQSPYSEYGPKGAMSDTQKLKLDAFKGYLQKQDLGTLDRMWHVLNGGKRKIAPKYPYDIELNRMLSERLGYEAPESETPKGEISDEKKQLPPGDEGAAPTTAPGGNPPGGPKSPELMTPDEYKNLSGTPRDLKAAQVQAQFHKRYLKEAFMANKPVNAAAADKLFWKGTFSNGKVVLPEGYVKEGDNYVFKSNPEPSPATPKEPESPKTEAEVAKLEQKGWAEAKRKGYTPAYKTKDGKIVTGESHDDAFGKSEALGKRVGVSGFVNREGKFLSLMDVARENIPPATAAPVNEHPLVQKLRKGVDMFEKESSLSPMERQNALHTMQMWVGQMEKAGVEIPKELNDRLNGHIDREQRSIRGENKPIADVENHLESGDAFKNKNWTADALKYGAGLDPDQPEKLAKLKALEAKYSQDTKDAVKTGDFDKIGKAGYKKQWVTEALQGAEGVEGRDIARSMLPPDYKPPFPKGTPPEEPPPAAPVPKNPVTPPVAPPAAAAAAHEAPPETGDETFEEQPKSTTNKDKAVDMVSEKFGGPDEFKSLYPESNRSHDDVVVAVERGLEMGKSEPEIINLLAKSRSPNGFLSALMRVANDPIKQEEAVRKASGKGPTPSEKVASENKNPPTPDQVEISTWERAWSEKQAALRSLRTGTDPNGAALDQAARDSIPATIAESNKVIEAMKAKHGTPDPGKYRAKMSGEKSLPEEPKSERQKLDPGDKVARTVGGKTETGTVNMVGATLQVFGPNGEKFGPDLTNWKKDASPAPEPVKSEPFSEGKFIQDIRDASKIKGKKALERLPNALDEVAPGLMKRGAAAVQKLRDALSSRGIEPDSPAARTETEVYRIQATKEALADAAKYQHFLDNGNKGYDAATAKSKLESAQRWVEKADEPADPSFRERAEKIASKLDVLKTPEKGTLSTFGAIPKVINEAVDAAKLVIRAGGSTLDAIAAAVGHVRDAVGSAWKDFNFRSAMDNIFRRAEDSGETPKPNQFLKTWIDKDVAPRVARGADAVRASIDFIVDSFSPASRAKPGDLDKLMEAKGEKDKFMLRAGAALDSAREDLSKMPRKDQISFVDRVKRGLPQATLELQQVSDLLRKWDDRLYAMATKWEPSLNYLDNHFRVLWKVVPGRDSKIGSLLDSIMSKRPWRGNRGFLLRHTLEDMSEGIEKGGVPVTYNPIDMFLLHAQDVQKYISANRAFENLKESGGAQFVERGHNPPPGFSKINDTIAKQYFSTKDTRPGEWYFNEGTAKLINNYLSVDKIRTGKYGALGRGLLDLKNMSTAVELGVSPFHAVFVTNEAIGSSLSLALAKMSRGDFAGAGKTIATAAQIPKEGRLISEYAKAPEEFKKNYAEEYDWLSKKYPQLEGMVNDLFHGGGVVEMQDDYKVQAAKGFAEAKANNNYIGAITRAVPALNQEMLKPIFQKYIPRLKLGTFMREYAFELDRRSDDLASGKITRGKLARDTWAFIDDRFGELNWDNLYWDRTFKSAMQLAFRSVTWKLGNIRGFGKAAQDLAYEMGASWWKEGRAPRITMPMGWLVGMSLVTAVESSILSKVFTGQYPWQLANSAGEAVKNLVFPRTDKTDPSQRSSVPTYFKDLVHAYHHPVDYVRSSMTGEIGRAMDTWNNKDFYGTQVYNPDDPLFTRMKDAMEHMIPVPFSISSQVAAQKSGASPVQSKLGYSGFTKAPYYMSHSAAEIKASELLQFQLPQGARTRENAEKSINEHKAVQAIKRGDMTIRETIDNGLVTEKKYKELYTRSHESFLETQIKRSSMTPEDAIKIWNVATPEEKQTIRSTVQLKIIHSRSLPADEKEKLLKQLNKNP